MTTEQTKVTKPLLSTLKGQKLSIPPVWIMRQAGRYLPEYRKIREKVDFVSLCHNPELACEVTLQPIKRFGFDGAILFSDILIPLEPMGMKLRFGKDQGPIFDNPIQDKKDVEQLIVPPGEACSFVGEALKLIKKELDPQTTLLGFAGAPFTLASYMIEGGSTKNFMKAKRFMYSEPTTYAMLMDKLVASTINYLEMQIEAGADAIQLFDSWGGQLSPEDYLKYAHPYSVKIINHIEAMGVPVIHFAKNGGGLLNTLATSPASGLGISWEVSLDQAIKSIPNHKCLQGNLDPISLFAPKDVLISKIKSILHTMSKTKHPHIFNLGHGILPPTPIDSIHILLETIRSNG